MLETFIITTTTQYTAY